MPSGGNGRALNDFEMATIECELNMHLQSHEPEVPQLSIPVAPPPRSAVDAK